MGIGELRFYDLAKLRWISWKSTEKKHLICKMRRFALRNICELKNAQNVCSFTDINFRQWATKIIQQPSFRKYRISAYISPLQITSSQHISRVYIINKYSCVYIINKFWTGNCNHHLVFMDHLDHPYPPWKQKMDYHAFIIFKTIFSPTLVNKFRHVW